MRSHGTKNSGQPRQVVVYWHVDRSDPARFRMKEQLFTDCTEICNVDLHSTHPV
jgi:hypothetical protein